MMFKGADSRAIRVATLFVLLGLLPGCELKSGTPTGVTPQNHAGQNHAGQNPTGADSTGAASAPSTGDRKVETATVSAEGSSTVYPICQAFAVEFEKKSVGSTVSVGRQGTGGGYKKFLNRQADIWNASRPIDPKEVDDLKQKGIQWIELNVAIDGIVIAVHPQNTWCEKLTCAQLKQIWEPDSKVKTWSDLDASWPAEPMVLFGADTDSGTFEYFTEEINGKKKATNTNYTPASDDNVLVQGIATNQYALGYIPFGYYVENTEKLKPVAVSATKDASQTLLPFVVPSIESILSGEYVPLARPLYMYVNTESLKRPEVADFLKFSVSEESQPLVEMRGFVRVQETSREKAMATLENALKELSTVK